ncbi:MAG: sulfoxide reductase heme-binding subunit YedZ [Gammaproteobacteria bacterium]|nr:sulfoxide reductase heme-binding subunit YedZ [Gammaproteobacteria bacterium]MDD9814876.1 sulfoxide reductase heme-binding subunit YedZ [Gammaproteobacteria bacterium]
MAAPSPAAARRGGFGPWLSRRMNVIKPLLFCACLIPFAWAVYGLATDNLGAEPVDEMTEETGIWGLRFLLLTLLVTPLRRITNWNALGRLRRMLGLFAFFYVLCHFGVYLVLDQFFDFTEIVNDIIKRNYILAGFTAFVILIPLAATSTNWTIKKLGGRRWQRLHRGVYFASIAAVVHFLWLVKADYTEPAIYAFLLALLFAWRIRHRQRRAP